MFKYFGYYMLSGQMVKVARIRAWTLRDAIKKFEESLGMLNQKWGTMTVILAIHVDKIV